MIADDDDDTHFCLRCHATILGLDNYVSHRKAGCARVHTAIDDDRIKSPVPSSILPKDETFSLKADDFFSSLELRSSSKKSSAPITTGGKHVITGVLTRSKATAAIQASSKDYQLSPPKTDWIGGHQLRVSSNEDNHTKLCKAVDDLSRNAVNKEEPRNKKWAKEVPLPNLRVEYEDTDEDSNDDYDDDVDDSEEEDRGGGPPGSHTGGKWKPTSSPVQWMSHQERDWHRPPPSHTGGKWKPVPPPGLSTSTSTFSSSMKNQGSSSVPPPGHTRGKWKPPEQQEHTDGKSFPPPGHTKGKWKPPEQQEHTGGKSFPPPGHTKGKWKPSDEKSVAGGGVAPSYAPPPTHTKGKWKPGEKDGPPPSHTKGKWIPSTSNPTEYGIRDVDIPPLRKSNGTVQYWCGPCNRRLASKIVYERHLKSHLHYKRTFQECEFEDASTYLDKTQALAHQNNPDNALTAMQDLNSEDLDLEERPTKMDASSALSSNVKARRKRKKTFVKCGVCRSKVYIHLMGKHLISHYHCRKGDIRSVQAQKLVLDNIHNVALQCPYQCAPCKFYCNTHADFLGHWRSTQHLNTAVPMSGIFWCSFCQFECRATEVMEDHLNSEEHSEVISVINRSVPIVIRKVTPLGCQTCGKHFLHNIQLRKHCLRFGHHGVTCSDDHQKRYNCGKCSKLYKTKVGLQRHLRKSHVINEYLCNACNVSFKNRGDALEHRRSKEHKYASLKKRNDKGLAAKELTKTCPYCELQVKNVLVLKEHLKQKHPERKHSCPLCGETFIISQEVASHIKSKSCSFKAQQDSSSPSNAYSCLQCPYKTDSEAEYLLHITLHTEPLLDFDDTKKSMPHYKCPVCSKPFSKQYLRCHLRTHTKERPFVCQVCDAAFVRKSNLINHKKLHGSQQGGQPGASESATPSSSGLPDTIQKTINEFLCNICGASFKKRYILQQHIKRHTGKQFRCPEEGCIYLARTPKELQPHMATHSDLRPYPCEKCDYRAKTKQLLTRHSSIHTPWKRFNCPHCSFNSRLATHLNRHLRLHSGEKPYKCPHCDYRCNNLENLRKHILSTNKHRGKHIYECKFCDGYSGSNFAKDFKIHLVNEHQDRFETFTAAASYVAGIYDAPDSEQQGAQFSYEVLKTTGKSNKPEGDGDPVVTISAENMGSAILLTSAANQDMCVNSTDDGIYIELASADDEEWSMTASYDVDESGTLVPFQTEEGDSLFQEHFHESL